jgi:hypothetical protein
MNDEIFDDLLLAEARLICIADNLRPLVAAGDAQVHAGTGEHVGVHVATLRRLLSLAEGREA